MTFDEIPSQVLALLQREGRVSYRALKRRFGLDDDYLEDLKAELIQAKKLAIDEDGTVLVWVGRIEEGEKAKGGKGEKERDSALRTPHSELIAGERRQLTVEFIDLVGSTTLSQQLDPEDYHGRVRAYQAACRQVIQRYDGHIAQYLGDGVLVYFGYPTAHDEDAVRAVRSGLEIVAAVGQLEGTPPLQVRIGIHTGPVVVGEIGAGERTERLALGEIPNLAARVQGQAEPNTVVISNATYRLVQGLFTCAAMGPQALKNVAVPLELYRVHGEGAAQSRFEAAVHKGLTPLVGRAEELALLQRRWEHAKAGAGQVVLLGGEPGIGKSRLVQELKEQLERVGVTRMEFRCSPYHQNSALYPIIDHLQRLLQFAREDSPAVKLEKLQHTLSHYRFPQADTVPLLAALLSLPHPEGAPPITLNPQKQKQKTQEALVAWIVEEAEKAAVYCAWEDLHWADPSTLEVLTLFVDQVPTTRLLVLLTFRPEFMPPWGNRSHLSQLTLSRLGRSQVEAMVEQVTGGKILPPEVVQQIVAKTDGVPLFVEELTKSVVESGGATHASPLPLEIPATLHDSLMARLDRLGTVKEVAQLGATIGREFSYEIMQAISPLDEATLQHGLKQLVEAELVYPRGLLPQAHYLFKHALIQDTAYQALLKSTRQQYHRQIAQVLAERFPETVEAQPELVAQHYTEAGLIAQAIPYWQRAGQRAVDRSAYAEAIAHFAKGLELLKTLPDTPERAQQELKLQIALGTSLMATRGYGAPEVEQVYTRARELSQQIGETPLLFPALLGLAVLYHDRAELKTARELGEQLLCLAQNMRSDLALLRAHLLLGITLRALGDLTSAHEHLEQSLALYDPQQQRTLRHSFAEPGVIGFSQIAHVLWLLGYPDQALKRVHEALSLARELLHPFSVAYALSFAAQIHRLRREQHAAQELEEARSTLSDEQGFALFVAVGSFWQGWALVEAGQGEDGIAKMHDGMAAWNAIGTGLQRPYYLTVLAEAYEKVGRTEEELNVLAEALAAVDKTGERYYEAELYRLKGTLTLQSKTSLGQVSGKSQTSHEQVTTSQGRSQASLEAEAEECFHKAIEISRKQQAKSLELRAVMSLAKLWQRQGKKTEAHQMLAEIYGWFTEGFDTKDLQEAKALLEELSH